MLTQAIKFFFSVIVRVVMMLAGLVFLASLLLAALVLLLFWLLRAVWARLTGQPVSPWTFQINRQAIWHRFYRPQGPGKPARHDDADVIDVEPREIKPPAP